MAKEVTPLKQSRLGTREMIEAKDNIVYHKHPYKGTNNRKKTISRLKSDARVQSVPIYSRNDSGQIEFNGYRHINH